MLWTRSFSYQERDRDPLHPNIGVENFMLGEKYIARDKNLRYCPVSLSEVKGQINSYITNERQKRWSQSGPTMAKWFFPKVNGGELKKLRCKIVRRGNASLQRI
jgi:hypothetical protein